MAKSSKPIPVTTPTVTVDTYRVMEECVERGIAYGYRRAFKHTETPDEDAIKEAVQMAIMNELVEWFRFGEWD